MLNLAEPSFLVINSYDDVGPELLNVSIRRIRLNSHILLNKRNRRKFNL